MDLPFVSAVAVAGLGHLGLGEKDKAKDEFCRALGTVPDLLGAKVELGWLATGR